MIRRHFAAFAVAGLLLATPDAQAAERVTVFAAASLKNALDDVITRFTAETGTPAVASYASSSVLAKQIEAGAPADIFFSADIPWMDYLAEHDLIVADSRIDLLGNSLVLVAPATSTAGDVPIDETFDLAGRLGDGRLAVGQVDSVPAGRYARAALQKLGMWPAVEPKLAQSDNVRAALALVAQDEAPLGIVYATDAASEPKVRIIGTFPARSHPPIIYPAALVKADHPDQQANSFLSFLQGADAAAAFMKAGFRVLDPPAS